MTSDFCFSPKLVLEFSSPDELKEFSFALSTCIVQMHYFRDKVCKESFQKARAQKDIDLLRKLRDSFDSIKISFNA